MSAEKTPEEMIEYMNNVREKINKIRDETPDPFCCKKCGEYKTDNTDFSSNFIYAVLRVCNNLSNEQLIGAIRVISYITDYLEYSFYYEKQMFSREILLQTLNKLYIAMIKFHKMTDKTQATHELLIEEIERENEVESLISEYNYGHGFDFSL